MNAGSTATGVGAIRMQASCGFKSGLRDDGSFWSPVLWWVDQEIPEKFPVRRIAIEQTPGFKRLFENRRSLWESTRSLRFGTRATKSECAARDLRETFYERAKPGGDGGNHLRVRRLYDLEGGKEVSFGEFLDRLDVAAVVLIGLKGSRRQALGARRGFLGIILNMRGASTNSPDGGWDLTMDLGLAEEFEFHRRGGTEKFDCEETRQIGLR